MADFLAMEEGQNKSIEWLTPRHRITWWEVAAPSGWFLGRFCWECLPQLCIFFEVDIVKIQENTRIQWLGWTLIWTWDALSHMMVVLLSKGRKWIVRHGNPPAISEKSSIGIFSDWWHGWVLTILLFPCGNAPRKSPQLAATSCFFSNCWFSRTGPSFFCRL